MRPEKEAIVREVREQLEPCAFVILSDYRGMTVEQFADLRGRLRESGTEVHVVKNAFLGHAVQELGWDGSAAFMDGPTAMIAGAGDVTEAAKIVKAFMREHKLPKLKGGWLEARPISADDVEAMAGLPTLDVMRGILAATLAAPMTHLVGVMQQKLLSLLYVLKAAQDRESQ
jgi:large subunit ribosomal protein L10